MASSAATFPPLGFRASYWAALMLAAASGMAANAPLIEEGATNDAVFKLGTVAVLGEALHPVDQVPVQIDAGTIELLEKRDLSAALSSLPGITLTRFGGRNETAVYVRGFARNQTPLFVDGVPVYVPYDGIIDLGRFMTYDVAAVSVAKGYSSALYGANTLGGAINIMTRQPSRTFEGQVTAGAFTGSYETALNVGGRQKGWYYQAGASYVTQDHYPLSSDFVSVPAENGGNRENSYRTDWKFSGKLAYTPNATDEYAIGIVHQEAEKGTPPQTTAPRYWQWPQWDKQTLYFVSNTRFGPSLYVKPRFYYDTYDNTLNIYDDATYTTMARPSSSSSLYRDYSYGGSLEAGTQWAQNTLKGIIHYKFDHHREFPDVTRRPTVSFTDEDEGVSYGLEDTFRLAQQWDLQAGFSYDTRDVIAAVDTATGRPFPTGSFSSFNPQAGVYFRLGDSGALHATIARKSRFPSMKDRYSYRMGQGIPNINLEAESAMHYELGYAGRVNASLSLNMSIYLSRIDDTIQQVFLSPTSNVSQFQNIGTSENRGIDVGVEWTFTSKAKVGLSYGYIHQETLTTLAKNTEPVKSIDTPKSTGSMYADLRPLKWLTVVPELQYSSWRYSFSDGKGTTRRVEGFTLANLKFAIRLPHEVVLSVGVKNLFDENYQLQEGYPEAGRIWYANARYSF